jgi:hypothetical protein
LQIISFIKQIIQFSRKGLVAFGTVDDRNIFHLLPRIDGRFVDWKLLRSLDISTAKSTQGISAKSTKDVLSDKGAHDISSSKSVDDVSTKFEKNDDLTMRAASGDVQQNIFLQKGLFR